MWSQSRGSRAVAWALLVVAIVLVAGVRALPSRPAAVIEHPEHSYVAENGERYLYLAAWDGFGFLRWARNQLELGSPCDEVVDGECRDLLTYAPVGARMRYADSLHIQFLAWTHRWISAVFGELPLQQSAFWLQILLGSLALPPVFWIAWRLGQGSALGAFTAALLLGLNPYFLARSAGADNDAWNVALPLWSMWALVAAIRHEELPRRLAYSGVAAAFVCLHAAIWRGWLFAYAIGLATLGFAALVSRVRTRSKPQAEDARAFLASLALFTALVEVGVLVFTAQHGFFARGLSAAFGGFADVAPLRGLRAMTSEGLVLFPRGTRLVQELLPPGVEGILSMIGGVLVALVAWMGSILRCAPDQWNRRFTVLLALSCAALSGLVAMPSNREVVLVLLAAPVAVGFTWAYFDAGRSEARRLIALGGVLLWFFAGLVFVWEAWRFHVLFLPPVAILLGVALGALQWRASRALAAQLAPRRRALLAGVGTGVAALACIATPSRDGFDRSIEQLPRFNVAWQRMLDDVHERTSPDSFVFTWWDYGYFVEYFARRGASADGASTGSRVPYWTAKALLAGNEGETLGRLRALACGSDPDIQGLAPTGAYPRLLQAGLDSVLAHQGLERLVMLNRTAAERWLSRHDWPQAQRDAVLASTHCQPPPALLLLSTEMSAQSALAHFGNWDFSRAYIASQGRSLPEEAAVSLLVEKFGQDEATVREEVALVRALEDEEAVENYITRKGAFVTPERIPCAEEADGMRVCRALVRVGEDLWLDSYAYPRGAPEQGLFIVRDGDSWVRLAPRSVLVAGEGSIQEKARPARLELSVLVDMVNHRAVIAQRDLLATAFTQLMYLDGRYVNHFEFFGEESIEGERIVAYRILWPEDGVASEN